MIPILLSALVGAPALPSPSAPSAATIPFESANKTIFVRTEVNARPFWFVLDTGAGASIMDLAAARAAGVALGDSTAVVGVGRDTVQARMTRNAGVHVVGLDAADQPLLLALPLDPLANASGHEFAGILGSDFIRRFVVEIDYEGHTLTLRDTATYAYRGHGDALPLTFGAAGFPQVTARVVDGEREARAGTFVLDTGSGAGLILHRPFVDEEGLLTSGRPTVPWIEGQGLGGDVAGVVGRVDALQLGRYRIHRPVTVFSRAANGPLASPASQGNIGAAILEKFSLTLDYHRMRIILEPNRRFAEPLEYNRSGLSLVSSGQDYRVFRVAAVADRSPAAEAGLQPGDRLVEVDGRPAETYTLSELRVALQDVASCRITIEREATRSTRTLVLRRRV